MNYIFSTQICIVNSGVKMSNQSIWQMMKLIAKIIKLVQYSVNQSPKN